MRQQSERGGASSGGQRGSVEAASTLSGPVGTRPDARTESLGGQDDLHLVAEHQARLLARGPEPRVGRYRLLHGLGAGAMGEVHLAFDDELGRPVAIKLVHPHLADSRSTARLRLEARALARLAHPNVVHVYEVGEHEGRTFLAMERVDGGSLREWIAGQPRPRWEQVLAAYLDAGRALAAAHRAGVVHRDFKPDNVLRGADGRVAVVDFGLAALELPEAPDGASPEAAGETQRGGAATSARRTEIAGTPAYMAPEQFRGRADARADQFALCVSIYEGLWGRRPFPRRTIDDVLRGRVDWTPAEPPRGAVAPWLWPILRRGLEAAPERRWPDVDALIAAIEAALARRQKRRRLALSGAAAIAAAALGGASVASWSEPPVVETCIAVALELDDTWDEGARTQLEQRFAGASAAAGASWLADSGAAVSASLDRWRTGWIDAREALCRERARGGDPVVLDRLGRCLERHRRAAQALVAALLRGDPAVLRQAPEAVLNLEPPRACDLEARRGGPPEPPAAVASAAQQVREELARAEAELLTGRLEAAWAQASPLELRAEDLGHGPLMAEVGYLLGRIALAQGRTTDGLERLERAVDAAEAGLHDALAASIWRYLAMYAATEAPDLIAGRRWLRRAVAASARVGSEANAEARLGFIRGNLSLLAGEVDLAVAELQGAETVLAVLGDLLYASHAASSLGTALLERGEAGLALVAFERALAQRERVFGPRHPSVARAAYNLAQALRGASGAGPDHQAAAGALLRRAVEIWAGTAEAHSLDAGRSAFVLAQLELDAGRFERAIALARDAEAVFRESLEPTRIEHAEVAALLGTGHYFLGQVEPAVAELRRAVAGHTAAHGEGDVYTASFRVALGWALLAAGDVAEARAELEAGRLVIEAAAEAGSEDSVDARLGLVAVDLVEGKHSRAAARLAEFRQPPTGELDRVTFALLSGIHARRRDPADPRGAAALRQAGDYARAVAGGQEMLVVLLDSLRADPAERHLALTPPDPSTPPRPASGDPS